MDKSSDWFGTESGLDNQTGMDSFQFGESSFSFGKDTAFDSTASGLGHDSKKEDFFSSIESGTSLEPSAFSDLSSGGFGSFDHSDSFDFLHDHTKSLFPDESSPFSGTSPEAVTDVFSNHSDDLGGANSPAASSFSDKSSPFSSDLADAFGHETYRFSENNDFGLSGLTDGASENKSYGIGHSGKSDSSFKNPESSAPDKSYGSDRSYSSSPDKSYGSDRSYSSSPDKSYGSDRSYSSTEIIEQDQTDRWTEVSLLSETGTGHLSNENALLNYLDYQSSGSAQKAKLRAMMQNQKNSMGASRLAKNDAPMSGRPSVPYEISSEIEKCLKYYKCAFKAAIFCFIGLFVYFIGFIPLIVCIVIMVKSYKKANQLYKERYVKEWLKSKMRVFEYNPEPVSGMDNCASPKISFLRSLTTNWWNYSSLDDYIKGSYKGVAFEFWDVELKNYDRDTHKADTSEAFKGQVYYVKLKKPVRYPFRYVRNRQPDERMGYAGYFKRIGRVSEDNVDYKADVNWFETDAVMLAFAKLYKDVSAPRVEIQLDNDHMIVVVESMNERFELLKSSLAESADRLDKEVSEMENVLEFISACTTQV